MTQKCPICQNSDLEQTTMGILDMDTNACYCHNCKWKGKVWMTQTACNECPIVAACDCAYDPYNYNTVPGIDCLAAK